MNISYVAAFLDGEGSVSFSLRENSDKTLLIYPQIRICNTHEGVIDLIQSFLKAHNIRAHKRTYHRRTKPYHELQIIGFQNILNFIKLVEAESIVKREHLKIMRRFCERRLQLHQASRDYWATHSHVKLPHKFVEYTREDYLDFLAMHSLNKRKLSSIGKRRLQELQVRFT